MTSWARTFGSSIGTKSLMALSGLALLLFVIAHLLGNLQIYLGPEAINAYGHLLKSLPELLWTMRIGLAAMFLLHISTAIRLTALNRSARPVAYRKSEPQIAGVAARSLIATGLLILAFVLFHLAHFTLGTVDPSSFHHVDEMGRHDVFRMVVTGFSNPLYTGIYVVAMIVLGFHLWHAIASLFQTLGLSHPRFRPLIEKVGKTLAVLLVLGNISIPLSILAGIVRLKTGG
ncbi:MAG: succinate dehydrogenase cytochrome b subunit [Gemmatimonadetes bacterium]|nr:succinate dehydrogenase cytochrome b subunit [Gemmatimonadota bacterium]